MAKDFQTGKFADFEQFKIDSHVANFGQVQGDPNWLSLLTLGRSQLFYWHWARRWAEKKQELGIGYGLSHFQWFNEQLSKTGFPS